MAVSSVPLCSALFRSQYGHLYGHLYGHFLGGVELTEVVIVHLSVVVGLYFDVVPNPVRDDVRFEPRIQPL